MKYKAKLSGQIPDPNNIMNTLTLEVSAESDEMQILAKEIWELKDKVEHNTKERSNVIFVGNNKQLPKEIMNGEY